MVIKSSCTIIFVIGFFTLLSSCNNNDTSEISQVEEAQVEAFEPTTDKSEEIVYRDFFLEQPLENGFRFGMLLSEWNKKLALFAKEGILYNLTDEPYSFYFNIDGYGAHKYNYDYDYFHTDDSYLGTFNSSDDKYSVLGIFTKSNSEVFKRNNVEINQPVLVGIKFKYFVDQSNVLTKIDNLIKDENLIYVAGSYPIINYNKPILLSEFDGFVNYYAVWKGGKEKEEECNRVDLFYNKVECTLFENEKYYAVIEVNIHTSARVIRDNNCEIYSILSGERKFYFTKAII